MMQERIEVAFGLRIVADEPFGHRESVLCGRDLLPGLQRLGSRRDEHDAIQRQRIEGVAGGEQVSGVRGIETPPKESDPHAVRTPGAEAA